MSKQYGYVLENRGYSTPCWIWQGPLTGDGYGMAYDRENSVTAHRLYYLRYKGPIPRRMDLDHLCKVRCCVNPEHLEAISRSENLTRRSKYGSESKETKEKRIAQMMDVPWFRTIAEAALKNTEKKENQSE